MNDKKVVATFQKQKVLVLSFVLCTGKKFLALAARSHCISRQIKNSPNLSRTRNNKNLSFFLLASLKKCKSFFSLSLFVWNTHSQPVSSGQQCSIPPPSPSLPLLPYFITLAQSGRGRESYIQTILSHSWKEREQRHCMCLLVKDLSLMYVCGLWNLSLSLLVFLT